MAQQTQIEWTDFTVNFWEGCQKVGPGCDNCYAEARNQRFAAGVNWGPGAPRRFVKGATAKLNKIRRDAAQFQADHGHEPRVFFSSLSDVFDNAVQSEWRQGALKQIDAAPEIHAILLTKRIGNVFQMIPPIWAQGGWPAHVGLMITVVNQTEANRDIPKLLDLKYRLGIPWVGLSVEPMLGPVKITKWLHDSDCFIHAGIEGHDPVCTCSEPHEVSIDWVICGGESGPNARPMHPDWVRSLRDQCSAAGTAFLFKQWGEHEADQIGPEQARSIDHPPGHVIFRKVGKKAAGRRLDGQDWTQFPEALNV